MKTKLAETKVCRYCHQRRPITQFTINSRTNTRGWKCSACRKATQMQGVDGEMRKCPNCGAWHPLMHYQKQKNGNRTGSCKACRTEQNRRTNAIRIERLNRRLELAITRANIPADEKFPEQFEGEYWNDWRGAWEDALILGKRHQRHDCVLWWVAILTVKSNPLVALVSEDYIKGGNHDNSTTRTK